MKKSGSVKLVLITAALAACQSEKQWGDEHKGGRTYLRSDSTAPYTRAHSTPGLWYYAFRPFGMVSNGLYTRGGYYSGALAEQSNIGRNAAKNGILRGGFGQTAFRAGS